MLSRSLRFATSRMALSSYRKQSTALPAASKLSSIFEEYREKNFGQTMFSRYVQQMISATDTNHDGKISLKELEKLLDNIGAAESISTDELSTIMAELGHDHENERVLDTHVIEELILQESK